MSLDETSVSFVREPGTRSRLVRSFDIDHLRREQAFQQLVEAAASVCDVPVAVVTLIDDSQVHLISTVGTEVRTLARADAVAGRIVDCGHGLVVEDAQRDARLGEGVPDIDGKPVRFYFGQPLMIDNSIIVGTLSLLDRRPRRISAHQRAVLSSIVRQIELQLEHIMRQDGTVEQSGMVAEIEVSRHVDVRRQALTNFLLHDVINAASAVKADADYVRHRVGEDGDVREALDDIAEAVDSMADLLQSARNLLLDAEATVVADDHDVDLRELLREFQEFHRPHLTRHGRALTVRDMLSEPYVSGEPKLLREMFDSLLAASLVGSPTDTDIIVELRELDDYTVRVIYRDMADPMSDRLRKQLFGGGCSAGPEEVDAATNIARDSIEALSLCCMIVEAHGGNIRVENSEPRGRDFLIDLPR